MLEAVRLQNVKIFAKTAPLISEKVRNFKYISQDGLLKLEHAFFFLLVHCRKLNFSLNFSKFNSPFPLKITYFLIKFFIMEKTI